jgi:opacity protein-like surface antigen
VNDVSFFRNYVTRIHCNHPTFVASTAQAEKLKQRVGTTKQTKMKTSIVLAAALAVVTLSTHNAKAQGPYLNLGAGFGIGMAGQNLGTNESSNSIEVVRGSYGKGFNTGIGFGYMFNEYIGMETNLNYLLGGKTTFTDNSSDNNPEDVRVISARMLRINPAMKFTYGENIKPYAKIGMIIGVAGKITETNEDNSGAPLFPTKVETTEEYTGGVSLGLSGALGVDIMFSDMIGMYVELGAIAQSYAPTKSVITQYDINGAQHITDLTTHDKETEYLNSYDPSAPDNDDSKPDQRLKAYSPFSSIGLNVGVHFAFGGAK